MKSVMALVLAGSGVAVAQDAVQWRVEDGGNGHWYAVYPSEVSGCAGGACRASQAEYCTSNGGMLVCLETPEEWTWVFDTLVNDQTVWGGTIGPTIGLYQDRSAPDYQEPNGGWYWETGEPLGYASAWGSGEPNNGTSGEDFAYFGGTGTLIPTWFDGGNGGGPWFLCEWSADCNNDGIVDYGQIVDGTLPDYDGSNVPDICEAMQWRVEDGGNGHWYRSIETPEQIDWVVASQYSENLGGHLATLSSENESNWVKFGLANNQSLWLTDVNGCLCLGPYIGARREAFGDWTWVDDSTWEFTDWHPGTPNITPTVPAAARFWDVLGNFNGYGWNDRPLDDSPEFSKSFIVEWSSDCNGDGIVDLGQYLDGTFSVAGVGGVDGSCDCDGDGISNEEEIANGSASDFNTNGIPDNCEADCDSDGIADFIEIDQGLEFDCNLNAIPDGCELADGSAEDANGNTFIDACEIDCNGNGLFDFLDLFAGAAQDCTSNGIPDSCDIAEGIEADCDLNGVPDSCETFADCDSNGIPDSCDPDCDSDGTPDACEGSEDCDTNGVPDECQADTDTDGTIDACDPDDDGDGIEDGCDVDNTMGEDCDLNGIDDTCDPDLDGDLIPDACDEDDDGDGIEDQCDVDSFAIPAEVLRWEEAGGGNGHYYQLIISETGSFTLGEAFEQVPFGASLVTITSPEEHQFVAFVVAEPLAAWIGDNGGPPVRGPLIGLLRIQGCEYGWVTGEEFEYERWHPGNPNGCEVSPFVQLWDRGPRNWQNSGGLFNSFIIEWSSNPQDCNNNGILDSCELETNDCNANGIPDDCDGLADCNANGVGDVCDIDIGTSIDVNLDGIPDECQCVPDIVTDGVVDFTDLLTLLNEYGPCPPPCRSDLNGDGVVDFADALRLLSAWGSCDG